MGLIPDDIIDTVRLRSDIVGVISRHVQLSRKGRYYTGLCPFHQERAPSFTVTPDKQIFYCYGCNVGGNVFKFLMLKENLTFVEAVKVLASQAGVNIPETSDPAEAARQQKAKLLRQINGLARDYFCKVLQEHEGAAPARAYLAERGITPEVIEQFQIGYAPPGWDHLLGFMKSRRIQSQLVVAAGLAQMKTDGHCYDRFRGRVIFPIWDITGQVIAFGGRVLDDALPKYLNSPETALFTKGRNLYGLHLAGKAVKEKGYITVMEGYMDVIAAHSLGVSNAVASLGTSLTREQGYLLLNHSKDIVLAYDADQAGAAATLRNLEMLREIGCQARVALIPEGLDPDDFLRRRGAAAWESLVNNSLPAIEYILKQNTENRTVISVTEKLTVMRDIFPYISKLRTGVEREDDLKTVSRALGISPEAVSSEYKKYARKSNDSKVGNGGAYGPKRAAPLTVEERGDARERAEEGLIRVLLEEPFRGEALLAELGSPPFRNEIFNKVFNRILVVAKDSTELPVGFLDSLDDDELVLLSRLLTANVVIDAPARWLRDYVAAIKREDRRERREEIMKAISEAEKQDDQRLFGHLWQEYILLRGIAEAERVGDPEQAEKLLHDYQRHKEGSESAERRSQK